MKSAYLEPLGFEKTNFRVVRKFHLAHVHTTRSLCPLLNPFLAFEVATIRDIRSRVTQMSATLIHSPSAVGDASNQSRPVGVLLRCLISVQCPPSGLDKDKFTQRIASLAFRLYPIASTLIIIWSVMPKPVETIF